MQPESPPPPNPILDAYESFCNDTPWVTRNVMISQCATWFLSFLFDPIYPLANIPYFTLFRFEIYRLLFSPFICTSFFSLIFIYMGFVENGRRLEQSCGSTTFAFLLLALGVGVNCAFLLLTVLLSILTNHAAPLHWQSHGIWMLLFGVIEVECAKAPAGSKRNIFGFMLPTMYYALTIFAIFSVLGGFQLSYLLSIGVGYLYGKGYLDRYLPEPSTLKRYEDNQLSYFVRQKGWIVAQESLGSSVWGNIGADAEDHSLALTSSISSSTGAQQQPPGSVFPTGPGRTLGSASKRPNATSAADARQARLKALDRKTSNPDPKHAATVSENVIV
mmetsp:Transcript_10678/g.29448  ORF Transcript_10678/g.29448 Transcript_10678/m.29448 type:complete len:332 (-) Transcript_10678:1098-2093(-)